MDRLCHWRHDTFGEKPHLKHIVLIGVRAFALKYKNCYCSQKYLGFLLECLKWTGPASLVAKRSEDKFTVVAFILTKPY